MVRDTLVFILAGGKGNRLMPLTLYRSKPAVPFAAQYRIIDFTVSNCINSGIKWIYMLTQYKSNSLAWHAQLAYSHHFVPEAGEFITTVPPQQLIGEDWYRGTADAVYQNFQFMQAIDPLYALILAGDHVYKMDYGELLAYHIDNRADVTIAVVETPIEQARGQYGVLTLDASGRVTGFSEKPSDPTPTPHNAAACFSSMGVYVFNTATLEGMLIEDARDAGSSHDFGRDILPKAYAELAVYGYSFTYPGGAPQYWRDVGTLDQYFEANIDLTRPLPELNMHDRSWPVHTRQTSLPPAKFVLDDRTQQGRVGHAVNSLVGPGCIISGARVAGSIVSPDVQIDERSLVTNSIIMSGARIGKRVHIDRAIIDKHTVVPDDSVIRAHDMRFDDDTITTESGIVVVPKKTPSHAPPSHWRRIETLGVDRGPSRRALAHVLVVDDDAASRHVFRELLEDPAIQPLIAESGPHALALAEQHDVVLAFVDVDLRPMDGVQVIAELRRLRPEVKVVLLAAVPDDPRVEQARLLGIADCIYKPFDFRSFTTALRRFAQAR